MVTVGIKGADLLLLGKRSEEPGLSGAQMAARHAPAEVLPPPPQMRRPAQARPRCTAHGAHGCPAKLRGTQLKSWVDSDGFSRSLRKPGGNRGRDT